MCTLYIVILYYYIHWEAAYLQQDFIGKFLTLDELRQQCHNISHLVIQPQHAVFSTWQMWSPAITCTSVSDITILTYQWYVSNYNQNYNKPEYQRCFFSFVCCRFFCSDGPLNIKQALRDACHAQHWYIVFYQLVNGPTVWTETVDRKNMQTLLKYTKESSRKHNKPTKLQCYYNFKKTIIKVIITKHQSHKPLSTL